MKNDSMVCLFGASPSGRWSANTDKKRRGNMDDITHTQTIKREHMLLSCVFLLLFSSSAVSCGLDSLVDPFWFPHQRSHTPQTGEDTTHTNTSNQTSHEQSMKGVCAHGVVCVTC